MRRMALIGIPLILLAAIWVLNTSKAGKHPDGCFQDCSVRNNYDDDLRVLSLNVLHDYPRFRYLPERLELIAKEIKRRDIDIVCLQEVPWTWKMGSVADMIAQQTGMNHAYLRANGNRWAILFEEGSAILSHYPLENVSFVELSPQSSFFEHRIALHATAVTPQGKVGVFVTHLTNGDPGINYEQVLTLKQFVERSTEPLKIVAGDFNAIPESPQMKILNQGWADGYRLANPSAEDLTCCIEDLTAPAGDKLEKRIDYIFLVSEDTSHTHVSKASLVFAQAYETADGFLWASDHAGLVIDVQPVAEEGDR
jgi:endonuclease/exonuclease/phosphatase family metal-dependent hydrolase